jgi:tRNA-dihydrouridine synthase A
MSSEVQNQLRESIGTSVLSIAPMIDWTYSHFRVLMRILAPNALLYTEMQTTGAVIHSPKRALSFQSMEHPIALQLGGSDPKQLAQCASMAEQAGFDEINLNLGCPSDKVQAGRFGACLMNDPLQVVACIRKIRDSVSIPVSAKTRIGIDDEDSYSFFRSFAQHLIDAGCQKIIVHARKAWLNGLSPKQNRSIPPLHYEYVYRLKMDFPHIPVHINGNISEFSAILDHLNQVDGVMVGRLACNNPYGIAQIHQQLYPTLSRLTRSQIYSTYLSYLLFEESQGASLSLLVKPLFNLAYGLVGAKLWKKGLMNILQSHKVNGFHQLSHYLSEIEMHEAL